MDWNVRSIYCQFQKMEKTNENSGLNLVRKRRINHLFGTFRACRRWRGVCCDVETKKQLAEWKTEGRGYSGTRFKCVVGDNFAFARNYISKDAGGINGIKDELTPFL